MKSHISLSLKKSFKIYEEEYNSTYNSRIVGSNSSTGTGTSGKTGNSGSSDNTIKRKSSEPSAADLLDRVRKNHPDPLEDARKALKEAQATVQLNDNGSDMAVMTTQNGLRVVLDKQLGSVQVSCGGTFFTTDLCDRSGNTYPWYRVFSLGITLTF